MVNRQETTALQVFQNPRLGKVRIVADAETGNPLFVAKDVAEALGYRWNGSSCVAHVPSDWRMVRTVLTISGPKPTTCLTEQGLYFFLSRSDKPAALPFQKWIAGEVIPAIRKHGGYGIVRQQSGQTPGTINPELSAIILERLSAIEASLAPVRAKANRYDAFLSFDGTCGLTEAAKLFGMSAIAFGKLLRSDSCHWLFKRCDGNARPNMPTKPVVDAGYMVVKIVKHKVGRATYMHSSARFTPKGLDALRTHLEKLGLVDETLAALPCISEATIDCQVTTVTQ